jgi:hypothetical protein
MPTAWRNVRYRVRSGKHLLATSISAFDLRLEHPTICAARIAAVFHFPFLEIC